MEGCDLVVKTQKRLADEIGITVVKLHREQDDIGFSVSQDEAGVYIKEINAECTTGRDGIIQAGDRLLWINRKHVEKLSLDEVKEILDNAPDGSNVVVARWQKHGQVQQKEDVSSQYQQQESQMIPNLITTEEPYMFEVTYLA